MDMQQIIAELRQNNAMQKMQADQQRQGVPAGGGTISPGTQFQNMDMYQSNNQQQANPTANVLDALKIYNNTSGGGLSNMFGGGGATGGAISSAMPALSAGGGSSLGSMGLMSSAPAVSFPGAASAAAPAAGSGGMMSGMGGALMSNPWTAAAAAILAGANYADNKGISSWKDTILGKGGGNVIDYYSGANDPKGNPHGFIGKMHDKDAFSGQAVKTMTDFSEGDFSNAWKNAGKAVKSIFKLKFF